MCTQRGLHHASSRPELELQGDFDSLGVFLPRPALPNVERWCPGGLPELTDAERLRIRNIAIASLLESIRRLLGERDALAERWSKLSEEATFKTIDTVEECPTFIDADPLRSRDLVMKALSEKIHRLMDENQALQDKLRTKTVDHA